jgi:transcriptional regulator with XRE-family HTH domain
MNVTPLDRHLVAQAFGKVLRAARRQRGLSQEALCEGADLDRTYPSLLERGLRTPTLTVLIEIARALHVEPAELIRRTVFALQGGES